MKFFNFFFHPYAQRVPKWKIAHIWQSKEQKNKEKTPKNESHKGFQSWPDIFHHPVEEDMEGGVAFKYIAHISIEIFFFYTLKIIKISAFGKHFSVHFTD